MPKRNKPKIGVIGFYVDDHVSRIGHCLVEHKVSATGFDLSAFPARSRLTVSESSIRIDEEELLEFDAFVLRQVGYMWPMPTRAPTPEEWGQSYEQFAQWMSNERESTSLKYSMMSILQAQKPVVNSLKAFEYHQMKPLMYQSLSAAGVPVPDWVASNDAEPLRLMNFNTESAPVVKPLAGGAEVVRAPQTPDVQGLQQAPQLYQRFVQGRSLRAFVIGEQVVAAAEIERGEALDWRKDAKGVQAIDLEPAVEQLAVQAAQALDMRFAALDFELTDDGPEFYDVNPTPMFIQFEKKTGLDIAGPLADYLIELARRGSPE